MGGILGTMLRFKFRNYFKTIVIVLVEELGMDPEIEHF